MDRARGFFSLFGGPAAHSETLRRGSSLSAPVSDIGDQKGSWVSNFLIGDQNPIVRDGHTSDDGNFWTDSLRI